MWYELKSLLSLPISKKELQMLFPNNSKYIELHIVPSYLRFNFPCLYVSNLQKLLMF